MQIFQMLLIAFSEWARHIINAMDFGLLSQDRYGNLWLKIQRAADFLKLYKHINLFCIVA
jgi:hypothetical protein